MHEITASHKKNFEKHSKRKKPYLFQSLEENLSAQKENIMCRVLYIFCRCSFWVFYFFSLLDYKQKTELQHVRRCQNTNVGEYRTFLAGAQSLHPSCRSKTVHTHACAQLQHHEAICPFAVIHHACLDFSGDRHVFCRHVGFFPFTA